MTAERAASIVPAEELPDAFEEESVDEFRPEEFDDEQDEQFDRQDVDKVGIIGGKGVGKSYLFQSMVYRALAGDQSGALTSYLEHDATELFVAEGEETEQEGEETRRRILRTGLAKAENQATFVDKYKKWQRLPFTAAEMQRWYRLRLSFRTGWLGGKRSGLDVEFFDGSGEVLERPAVYLEERALWKRAFLKARVMVFCMPVWVVFPNETLTADDWVTRENTIKGFGQVVQNYRDMRRRNRNAPPVSSILALTMADDSRSALRALYDRWIFPYMESPQAYLKQLRTGRGVARYLANAREVSEALREEFSSSEPLVAALPSSLDFGKGTPWIVAVSAMEGAYLEYLSDKFKNPDDTARARETRKAPVPVHVELPLLLALCERENALM